MWDSVKSSITGGWKTARTAAPDVFRSIDFVLGGIAGLVVFVTVALNDQLVARFGLEFAVASVALGIAIVGLALTALAILVGLMTDTFALILDALPGRVRGVFMTYQVVALIGAIATLGGLTALLLGSPLPHALCVVGVAGLAWVDVWAIVGTMQVVGQTAHIGVARARHYQGLAEAGVLNESLKQQRGNGKG